MASEPWFSKSAPPPDFYFHLHGVTFHLNKRCFLSRSAKMATLLEERQDGVHSSHSLADFPADPKTFELVARFCYGYEPDLSAETVIPLACAASYLEMTEEYSPKNLLRKTLSFFSSRILPHWNETLKAFRTVEPVLSSARNLGLVDGCLRSIAEKALADPQLLKNPVENPIRRDNPSSRMIGAKRRLFLVDWYAEDLTSLSLHLYALSMSAVALSGISPEHVAECLFRYGRKKANVGSSILQTPADDVEQIGVSVYEKSHQREVIEALEKLLPDQVGALHVKYLFKMLRSAIFLQACVKCINGFESRIGKQLAEASVDDLFIPCYGYSNETRYDMKCVKRILIQFCSDYNTSSDVAKLAGVSDLMEEFLADVARDADLKKEMFVSLLEMVTSLHAATGRSSDGVYRAVDVYLDAHGHMTESEKEHVCKVVDLRKMTAEALEHAAHNERMPLRMVAQVLFIGQVQIRKAIDGAMMDRSSGGMRGDDQEMEEKELRVDVAPGSGRPEGGASREETVKMDSRVIDLERENDRCSWCGVRKKKKRGFWKEMKWKLGCKSGVHDCKCRVKKKVRCTQGTINNYGG